MNTIAMAPTTLMRTPPLEYIEAAARAGYEAIGFRLYPSPGMTFFPVVGDADLERRVRRAIADARLQVLEILTCYLQPEMDLEAMRRAHAFGAELGAKYALVIGDDPDWGRMVDNFGRLCENAAALDMVCALETPVNRRRLTTLQLNLKLIEDSGRENAVICLDPVQYFRAGHTVDMLESVDPGLMPYTQICDAGSDTPVSPYCMPGEGIFPLFDLLDVLPQGLPLSLEYHHRDDSYTPAEWARHVLEGTKAFLERYYASRAARGV